MNHPCRFMLCSIITVSTYVCLFTSGGWNQIFMMDSIKKFVTTNVLNERKENDLEVKFEHLKFWEDELTCKNVFLANDLMTSEAHSRFKLQFCDEQCALCQVEIIAVSWSNVSKKVGGDLFLLWAEQVKGDGRSNGYVIDNKNGSYTGRIKILWPGETDIKVKLASTIENFCRRKRSMLKFGDSRYALKQPYGIGALFQNNSIRERTRCATGTKIKGYNYFCNLTAKNDGSPWFCGKPISPKLSCDDIYIFDTVNFKMLSEEPTQNPSEILSLPGHGKLKHSVKLHCKLKKGGLNVACRTQSRRDSWFINDGFYLNGTWRTTDCPSNKVISTQTYRKCLYNKTLVFIGDSTVRQYASYFLPKNISLFHEDISRTGKGKLRSYHPDMNYKHQGFQIIYKKHEMPFHHPHMPPIGITSVATEIQALSQQQIAGKDLIILFNYNSHFLSYPPDQIQPQIKRIVKATEILLSAKPETSIFIRGPHIYFDNKMGLDLRLELVLKDIVFREFRYLQDKVVYLDTWSISVAFNNEKLHPTSRNFESQIQQFLSYIC